MKLDLIVTVPFRLLSLLAVALAGCSGPQLLNRQGLKIPVADETHPVVRVICIWEPAEGIGLDHKPTRGFAGKVMFFMAGNPSPIRVDGDVRVYLFDDQGTLEQQAKPIHQFDFLGDAWTSHLQQSSLGPAYQIFIPYVRRQPTQTRSGLRVRLVPKIGPAVFSETVHVTLPGPVRKPDGTQSAKTTPTATATGKETVSLQLGTTIKRRRGTSDALRTQTAPSAAQQDRRTSGQPSPKHSPATDNPLAHRRFRLTAASAQDRTTTPLREPTIGGGVAAPARKSLTASHPLNDKAQRKHPLADE